jgi:hypothetical protein
MFVMSHSIHIRSRTRETRDESGLCRSQRADAYERGVAEFDRLARDPTFRDFVGMYMAQGAKRSRSVVAVGSDDPAVVALAAHWVRRLSDRRIDYQLEFDAGQDLVEMIRFWSRHLGVSHEQIKLARRSGLRGGSCGSSYGTLTVRAHDAILRARLQAWTDEVRSSWTPSPEPEFVA